MVNQLFVYSSYIANKLGKFLIVMFAIKRHT